MLHAPWRKLYKTARWRALRMVILTRDMFTCQWPSCGLMTADTSQLVVDHKRPHRGDEALFWDERNLQCLCAPCHNSRKQRAERAQRHGPRRPTPGGEGLTIGRARPAGPHRLSRRQ